MTSQNTTYNIISTDEPSLSGPEATLASLVANVRDKHTVLTTGTWVVFNVYHWSES